MRAFTTTTLLSAIAAVVPVLVAGQLTGSVGPETSIADKSARKICNVLNYGAVADKSTDVGPAIYDAQLDCRDAGGIVYIPEGDYAMETWVTLSGGEMGWAIQLDGTIHRTGTDGGNMFMIKRTRDFEMFSSTGKGAIQGNGYEFHADDGNLGGPRILRLTMVDTFSVHDITLVDAPAFHFSLDTCTNGEVYNMAIRGADHGGLDGIDVWGENIWIHDVMVTNKDECVTIKNPSHNMLVESIYCNWSGGSAFGSLGGGTNISDITYRNIYIYKSNQMMMIKSNGGDGTVSNVLFENFIGHSNAYSLNIDQYWSSMSTVDGDGVQLNNFTITNWRGTCENGKQRGPIKVLCADGAPCTDIKIDDFAMWTESGEILDNICLSAYGTGACLKDNIPTPTAYEIIHATTTVAPSNYAAPTMAEDLEDSFGFTVSIPIPTIPASFFPDTPPISPLAGKESIKTVAAAQSVSAETIPTTTTTTTVEPTTITTTTKEESATATPTESSTKRNHHHHRQNKHDRKRHHH
ncbi:RGase A [Zychaea mexicana]|uniref:RGase A n=1 Tax=Zychaea mexicana TaxID=64656 RepID=UPI0022FDDA87|nr:RGase A [Zychaea mexicana]KAI9499030.1 RGase A [Zychaea mexicana]